MLQSVLLVAVEFTDNIAMPSDAALNQDPENLLPYPPTRKLPLFHN
jgi:hypothetical protein